MLSIEQLQKVKIDSVEAGKELVTEINSRSKQLMYDMAATDNNEEHRRITDERYELRKAKRQILSQMGKIFRETR